VWARDPLEVALRSKRGGKVTALIWSTSSLLECWMHRLDYKSTSAPHGILCEFGCNQESVAASIPAKFGSRCPRPYTGSAWERTRAEQRLDRIGPATLTEPVRWWKTSLLRGPSQHALFRKELYFGVGACAAGLERCSAKRAKSDGFRRKNLLVSASEDF
jgi:hypothetical protein